ncbi:glycosyltransferase family 2 protein [Saccharopolyspora sp. HNM0983]|uniref:Glycosyltransferase family 2 protein n=1 Tax=Saccharopolyspora montiporae TaxID=2781240 RepID=A0A929B9F1_9PSEU|nr:glycosyltransferase family 2 protein [Saccharopolyspora sp. HNM0983]MBE9373856.1 glycosyltransferase family 2 protein [Saccharopolyspora sp. HNM0983]
MPHPVTVVLPCLDEAEALPAVLAAIAAQPGLRPLVVDNGSTDGTPEVAEQAGATVVREPRPGYGAAVHTGLEQADGDIVCVVDADGSIAAADLPALVEPVRDGRAELAVGRRVPTDRTAFPWHARAGNVVLAWRLRRLGVPVHDLGPVRVARRADLLALGITDRAFGYPLELLLRAGRAGWRIEEIPMDYRPRTAGRSKVTGSVRGTMRAVRDMWGVLR